jgi:hypothetical protein
MDYLPSKLINIEILANYAAKFSSAFKNKLNKSPI